jgi:hypothetical protein
LGGKGRSRGNGGEMTPTLYAQKKEINTKKERKKDCFFTPYFYFLTIIL